MKQQLAVAITVIALLLTACASQDPWHGFSSKEKQEWSVLGISPSDAKELRKNGLTPTLTKNWIKSGIKKPATILKWYGAGFTAKQSAKFIKQGVSVKKALAIGGG
ncbi:hypothetical protein QWY77_05685 [Thalassotalea ponticola]|uniref:hypothetical protein n=1 Tax=Thalassotalea ponticola TaxID=1523392 RepID=UPI0025B4B7A2|nr:hypothetical protein [Thalassotalea ponticola]MDN3652249.1 hypothetical protein [Thalassotalea ponticola]